MLVASTSTHLAQLGALSPNGRSKSFDASADGYGRGEACISAVLRLPGGNHEALAVMLGELSLSSCSAHEAQHASALCQLG